MPKAAYCVIFTTLNSQEEAGRLARLLVKEKCAACVSVFPAVESIYWWQGKIIADREWMLMIKTTTKKMAATEKIITDNHPYTVPEILALPVQAGAESYLRWMRENTR